MVEEARENIVSECRDISRIGSAARSFGVIHIVNLERVCGCCERFTASDQVSHQEYPAGACFRG